MYAVIKTGGKQYRVAENDTLSIERVAGEAGDIIEFKDVLMVGSDTGVEVGSPMVEGATVAAELLEQFRDKKIIVFKKKRRKNYRRKNGHRQLLTKVCITEILTGGKKPSKKAAAKTPAKEEVAPAEAEAAADAKPAKADAAVEAKQAEVKQAEAKQAEVKEAEAEAKPAKKPAKKAAKKAAAKTEAQEPLFETPAGEPDDLKKISGVGPALEKKLHGLGVTTYAQVAAFTAEEIAKVDDALSFKGRIERDDWVGQAKKLADGE